jgi:transcriptional regulator with XRE-family HTH domain
MQFKEWLNAELRQRDLSRSELARQLKVEQSTVSRWLGGIDTTVPNVESCAKMAELLGVDQDVSIRTCRSGRVDQDVVMAAAGHPTGTPYGRALSAADVELQRITLQRDIDAAITYIENLLGRLRSQRAALDGQPSNAA